MAQPSQVSGASATCHDSAESGVQVPCSGWLCPSHVLHLHLLTAKVMAHIWQASRRQKAQEAGKGFRLLARSSVLFFVVGNADEMPLRTRCKVHSEVQRTSFCTLRITSTGNAARLASLPVLLIRSVRSALPPKRAGPMAQPSQVSGASATCHDSAESGVRCRFQVPCSADSGLRCRAEARSRCQLGRLRRCRRPWRVILQAASPSIFEGLVKLSGAVASQQVRSQVQAGAQHFSQVPCFSRVRSQVPAASGPVTQPNQAQRLWNNERRQQCRSSALLPVLVIPKWRAGLQACVTTPRRAPCKHIEVYIIDRLGSVTPIDDVDLHVPRQWMVQRPASLMTFSLERHQACWSLPFSWWQQNCSEQCWRRRSRV